MPTPRQLYPLIFKVRPSSEHPEYYQVQFGYLFTWVAEHFRDSAADAARTIVGLLPFELITEQVRVCINRCKGLKMVGAVRFELTTF